MTCGPRVDSRIRKNRAIHNVKQAVTRDISPESRCRRSLRLAVLKFLVPGHLNGFEFGFVGGGGVAGEAGEFGNPFVHVREPDSEWIGVRKFVRQADSNVFGIVPTESRWHIWLLLLSVVSYQLYVQSTKS